MISIYFNRYSKEEVTETLSILEECKVMLHSAYCNEDCHNCKYKRLCRDIVKAIDYTEGTLKSRRMSR